MVGKMDKNVRIEVLGNFRLIVGDRDVSTESWRLTKASDILKYLIMRRREWLPVDVFLEEFWPELDPDKGRNNLHVTMHTIRKVLEPGHTSGKSSYVLARRGFYYFSAESVSLDVDEFESLIARGLRERVSSVAMELIEQALEKYKGDFLQEHLYDDWMLATRDRYREMYFDGVRRLCRHLASTGDWDAIVTWSRTALRIDRFREEFHSLAIEGLMATERFAEALEQYKYCVDVIQHHLGAGLGESVQKLGVKLQCTASSTQAAASSEITQVHLSFDSFFTRIEEETARAARHCHRYSLVLLSRIQAKQDKAVSQDDIHVIGKMARRICRPYDVVGTYKGTVAIMLPMTDKVGVKTIARRLIIALGGMATSSTLYFGCATYPDDGESPTQILEVAVNRLKKKTFRSSALS